MKRNLKLKIAILETGQKQYQIAKKVKVDPAILSMAVCGRYNLSNEQKNRIAKVLNRRVDEIF